MSSSYRATAAPTQAAFEAARIAAAQARLLSLVAQLQIPAADTADIDRDRALLQAQQRALARHTAAAQDRLAALRQRTLARGEALEQRSEELLRVEQELVERLEAQHRLADQRLASLDQAGEAQAALVSGAIDAEIQADGQLGARSRQRAAQRHASAAQLLSSLDPDEARRLDVDLQGPAELLAAGGEEIGAAARAEVSVQAAATALRCRRCTLAARAAVLRAELSASRAALALSDIDPAARVKALGTGPTALDAPLRQRLEDLDRRVDEIDRWEGHEVRLEALTEQVDQVASRCLDLVAQVREAGPLDRARGQLITRQLPQGLSKALGERVTLLPPRPGDLPERLLEPVEVHYETASGERVDVAVGLDGALRIHHHGHQSQAACAQAAERLAQGLSGLVQATRPPVSDLAMGASAPSRPLDRIGAER